MWQVSDQMVKDVGVFREVSVATLAALTEVLALQARHCVKMPCSGA